MASFTTLIGARHLLSCPFVSPNRDTRTTAPTTTCRPAPPGRWSMFHDFPVPGVTAASCQIPSKHPEQLYKLSSTTSTSTDEVKMSTSYGITLGQAPTYSSKRILQIYSIILEIRTGIKRLSANQKGKSNKLLRIRNQLLTEVICACTYYSAFHSA